ncbi:PREDICTED: uncharacterized protein LOC104814777 [Tarenaya hassleriana]|uniref:uncharacterized protein LOC104814777 n=1 Tax=Tarenaya hassleriana TaxID=28532 RepID=UPI00053C0A62|nr:PREDICTED: uncharacterized protein LOC104814777 [Tarenaya hassleriana]
MYVCMYTYAAKSSTMADSNKDQAKPLAPLSHAPRSDQPEEDDYGNGRPKHVSGRTTRCILCFGFVASFVLLLTVTFIVLALTLFHIRNPNLTVHSASFSHRLEIDNGTIRADSNLTVTVKISVHNPNAASFSVTNGSTMVWFVHEVIGEGGGDFPVKIPAKKTVQMNLTAEIVTSRLASVPGLNGRGMNVSSAIRVDGKVKIMKIFKKSFHLRRDCTMMYNTSELTFHDVRCQKHVEI